LSLEEYPNLMPLSQSQISPKVDSTYFLIIIQLIINTESEIMIKNFARCK